MPMTEFRYNRNSLQDEAAAVVGVELEQMLRDAIKQIRPWKSGYGVTVEGDPFSLISHNQPDLRIYVFYHAEWQFTDAELKELPRTMMTSLDALLTERGWGHISRQIRFYARHGHASS